MVRFNTSGFYLAMVALIVLAAYMVWGNNGYMAWVSLKKEEARILKKNQDIGKENQRIETIISRLKQDGAYIEHIAKHEFNLAGEDELIFMFEPEMPVKKGQSDQSTNGRVQEGIGLPTKALK